MYLNIILTIGVLVSTYGWLRCIDLNLKSLKQRDKEFDSHVKYRHGILTAEEAYERGHQVGLAKRHRDEN